MTNLSSLSKAKYAALFSSIAIACALIAMIAGAAVKFIVPILLIALILGAAAIVFVKQAKASVIRTRDICRLLAHGDFEQRITNITEQQELSELLWAINEMTDFMDAFVRESTAAMEYASRNQYFRRILEDGMHGALRHGTRTINAAMQSIETKMNGFREIANDVDETLKSVSDEIQVTTQKLDGGAKTMDEVVKNTQASAHMTLNTADETSGNVQTISAAAEEMSSFHC